MPPRPWAIAVLALLSAVAISRASDGRPAPGVRLHALAGRSHLMAYGSRAAPQHTGAASAASGKLDGALADLARHASRVRPGPSLADLHTLNPALRFTLSERTVVPLVLIDAVTRGEPGQLRAALESLGLEKASIYSNDVGGWLPVTSIEPAAARPELYALRAAMPHTRAGRVTSQGDFAQRSDVVRSDHPTLTGAGVTVGVLSDSFNCYAAYEAAGSGVPAYGLDGFAPNGFLAAAATDEASGDLPSSVNVLEEAPCLQYGAPYYLPFTDEGRAMLQIVHDVAPGAALAFYTADGSEADFANGIGALAKAGATVEADDTGYYDEPFFQDGLVANAIDAVEAQGVAYFSAAGNDADLSYENLASAFTTLSGVAPNDGEYLLNFDTTGATTTTSLPVTIPALFPGEYVAIVVEWDQPYVTGAANTSPGASSQIDLCVTGAGSDLITDLDGNAAVCTQPNAIGKDPVQVLIIGNPADAAGNSAAEQLNVQIGVANGTPAPERVKLVLEGDGAAVSINEFATGSATLQGHPGAAGAIAVGAAFFPLTPRCGTSPAMLESYSSLGGAPILFAYSGARLTTPEVRQKPDVVGPDGANTTFFGLTLAEDGIVDSSSISQCADDTTYPNFFGTSAATPHVAGIASLLLAANSANTPALIYSALRSSALPMGPSTPNFSSGYGFVQADAALALLPAAPASHGSGGGGLGGTALLILAALVATRLSTRRHQHLRGAHRH